MLYLIVILVVLLFFCLIKWLGHYAALCAFIHYYTDIKNYELPTGEDMQYCLKWAYRNMKKDLFRKFTVHHE